MSRIETELLWDALKALLAFDIIAVIGFVVLVLKLRQVIRVVIAANLEMTNMLVRFRQ